MTTPIERLEISMASNVHRGSGGDPNPQGTGKGLYQLNCFQVEFFSRNYLEEQAPQSARRYEAQGRQHRKQRVR